MSLIDSIIGSIVPHECLACGQEGKLLCCRCSLKFLQATPACCYRCKSVVSGSATCMQCRRVSALDAVRVRAVYSGYAKSLVWQLKFNGAQAVAREIAEQLVPYVDRETKLCPYIIPVPTATGRVRRRGYDQAKLLAKALSRQTKLPYIAGLRRHGQTHQIGASRQQRLSQLGDAFTVSTQFRQVLPKHVILIDDVITTGATLEAAANVLRQIGVVRVEAIVFARA